MSSQQVVLRPPATQGLAHLGPAASTEATAEVVWDASLVPYAQAWTQELLMHCDGVLDVNGLAPRA